MCSRLSLSCRHATRIPLPTLYSTFRSKCFVGKQSLEWENLLYGILHDQISMCVCVCDICLTEMFAHCFRVASFSEANKMPVESLAKIFGPTLVGHASAKPDPSVQWSDVEKQPKACALILSFPSYHYTLSRSLSHPPPPSLQVVLRLLKISPDYWRQYLSPMENPEPMTSPNIGSAQSSPGFTSPATPEQRPGTCCTDSVHVHCIYIIMYTCIYYMHVYIQYM